MAKFHGLMSVLGKFIACSLRLLTVWAYGAGSAAKPALENCEATTAASCGFEPSLLVATASLMAPAVGLRKTPSGPFVQPASLMSWAARAGSNRYCGSPCLFA